MSFKKNGFFRIALRPRRRNWRRYTGHEHFLHFGSLRWIVSVSLRAKTASLPEQEGTM
jgi:hypothetical protein